MAVPPIPYRPYGLFIWCFLSVALGAMDSVLASAYLPNITRDLLGSASDGVTGQVGSWLSFCFLIGGATGGMLMGFLTDRLGRTTALAIGLFCYGAGSGLGALAPSWQVLAAMRLFIGAGVGTVLVVTAVVISEQWEARTRAVALGILSVAYPVGIITSGIITAQVGNWRVAFGIGAAGLLLIWPVKKSILKPVIHQQDHTESSRATLGAYQNAIISGILVFGSMLIGIWSAFSWLPTWIQSLMGEGNADGQSQRGLGVALLGMGGMVGGILSGFLANYFGRKPVQTACFIACFILSYFLFQMNTTYTIKIPIGIALLGTCFGMSQGVLNTYIPELFPPVLRASATGLCFHTGRIFTAAAVWFVGAFVVWFGSYGDAIFAFSFIYILGLLSLYISKK